MPTHRISFLLFLTLLPFSLLSLPECLCCVALNYTCSSTNTQTDSASPRSLSLSSVQLHGYERIMHATICMATFTRHGRGTLPLGHLYPNLAATNTIQTHNNMRANHLLAAHTGSSVLHRAPLNGAYHEMPTTAHLLNKSSLVCYLLCLASRVRCS